MPPTFNIDPEKLAAIRAQRGLKLPNETDTPEETPKRRRGRPRKIVAPAPEPEMMQSEPEMGFEPAPLINVDEKLFAQRLQGFFTGVTGLGGAFVKPYLLMTDEEAEAIAIPLSSYLLRRAPDSEAIREFVNNYDLLAIATGTGAYMGRIYKTRKQEVEAQRIERARNVRSPSSAASRNTTEEPSEFNAGSEDEVVSPIRTEPGPFVRVDGQP